MNKLIRQLAALLALAVLAAPAFAQQKPQVITVPVTDPSKPVSLEIEMQSARIEVIGENRKDAQFEIQVAESQRRIVTPSGTQLIRGGAFAVEIEEEDNEISFDADWRTDKVNVVVRIPRLANLELSTINDGEIIVDNIEGNLKLSNVNGPITANNISGSVIASSVNEDIKVRFRRVTGDNATSFETINGDLHLGLPARQGVQVQLDTAQGQITSDFEVEVMPSEAKVERRDELRGSVVRIENVIVAKVNGGGPIVRMKGLYGDIYIEKVE